MERIIMHIDVNNAFLSWTATDLLEKGYKLDIRTIESIIAKDPTKRTSLVLAKSPLAKKKGIKTAETIYEAKRKCPNLKIYKPNYQMYQEKSSKLFNLIKIYTPDIEIASIDECYIDYTKVKNLYKEEKIFAENLKNQIKKELGFTVNIGIANNKLCAKMASDFEKPDKIHTLYQNEIKEKMYPLPIEELFTVGKKTSEKLKELGIKKIKDLATANEYNLRKIFKNQAKYLIEIANGIDNEEVKTEKHIPKGISNEITLEKDITSKQEIKKVLKTLSEMLSKRIQKEEKYAQVICLVLKNSNFKRYSHQKKLKNPINSYEEIYTSAQELLNKYYKEEKIRLVGLRLDNLKTKKNYQTSLFEQNKEPDKIETLIKKINQKYGKNILKRASFIENDKK